MKTKQAHCHHCDQLTLASRDELAGGIHVVHALISLFTCGLWLLVWLIHASSSTGPWRCQKCGTETDRKPQALTAEQMRNLDDSNAYSKRTQYMLAGIGVMVLIIIMLIQASGAP